MVQWRWVRWFVVLSVLLSAAALGCGGDDGGRRSGDDDDDDAGDDDDSGDDDDDDDDDDDSLIWKALTPSGQVPGPLGFLEAVADAGAGRMLFYGGIGSPYPEVADALMAFDFATDSFSEVVATGDFPEPLFWPATGLDPATDRLYLFGGGTDPGMASSELYVMDLDDNTWTLAGDGAGTIGDRLLASGVWDAGRLLVFGGASSETKGELFSDLWSITWNGVAGEADFTPIDISGPAARSNAASCLDAADGYWYLFGGAGTFSGFSDVWRLDLAADAWEEVQTTGDVIPNVHSARCHVDPAGRRLIAFGGFADDATERADVWVLDLAADPPSWTTVPAALQAISPRYAGAMAYDAGGDRLVYFGGVTFDAEADQQWTFFGDLYEMSLAAK